MWPPASAASLHPVGRQHVGRKPAQVLVEREALVERREGALRAVEALAQPAGRADRRGGIEPRQIEPLGIDELARMAHLAGQTEREVARRMAVSTAGFDHLARQAQEGGTARQLRQPDLDDARETECIVEVQPRTGAAEAREWHPVDAE